MKKKRTLFTLLCLFSLLTQAHASSIWEEGSQWDVYYIVEGESTGTTDSVKVTYRLLPAFDNYMALEKTFTINDMDESVQIQGYIRNAGDSLIYVRPVLDDGSIGDECLLYDFREPYEYGHTLRYGVIGGEVKEEFIDWQEDSLDYYMMNNGDTHCLPAWKGIIYKYGYIGGPMDLFLLEAVPGKFTSGKNNKPKPTNISHVIFSTKGGHKINSMSYEEDDIIVTYNAMLKEATTWECMAVETERPDFKKNYSIQVMGDTLIGNRRCKQVYSPEYDVQKILFEEGRKVYIVNADGNPEVLLDFNLQEGDHWLDDVATVVSVDNQENLGYDYRTITIDTGLDCQSYFEGDTSPWAYNLIEGIGVSKDQHLKQHFISEKNTFSYMLRCWKDDTLVYQVAQEHEYIPFVREGVKWVCDEPYLEWMRLYHNYYTLELAGDTLIDGKCYKAMHKYSGDAIDETNDTVPVYLREENKIVYGIVPNGKTYKECPVGMNWWPDAREIVESGKEFVLYDFNDPINFIKNNIRYPIEGSPTGYQVYRVMTDQVIVAGKKVNRYIFPSSCIIEGIGCDGVNRGYPLSALSRHLRYVIENGDTIYTSKSIEKQWSDDDERVLPIPRQGVQWVNERVIVENGDTTQYYYKYEFRGADERGDGIIWSYTSDTFDRSTATFAATYQCYNYAINGSNGHIYNNWPFYKVLNEGRSMVFTGWGQFYCFDRYATDIDYSYPPNFYIGAQRWNYLNRQNLIEVEPVIVEGIECERYAYLGEQGDTLAFIVQGIGFDSYDMGDLLTPFTRKPDPTADYQEWCGLSHVVKDGQIIYKGMRYRHGAFDGINEVVVDLSQHVQDGNYYNLMGQPVGKDVPTVPGIYIHQGKKILVR